VVASAPGTAGALRQPDDLRRKLGRGGSHHLAGARREPLGYAKKTTGKIRNPVTTCWLAAAGLRDTDEEVSAAMIDCVDSVRHVSDHVIEQVREAEAQAKAA
jgi:hypothetical protein